MAARTRHRIPFGAALVMLAAVHGVKLPRVGWVDEQLIRRPLACFHYDVVQDVMGTVAGGDSCAIAAILDFIIGVATVAALRGEIPSCDAA